MRSIRGSRLGQAVVAVSLVAGAIVGVGATPAAADDCTGHSQPGITVGVGDETVRIPAVVVAICRNTEDSTWPPDPIVVTEGPGCTSGCLAVVLDHGGHPSSWNPGWSGTITVTLDGAGVDETIVIPGTQFVGGQRCYFGVGFPSPPRTECFVRIDPDN